MLATLTAKTSTKSNYKWLAKHVWAYAVKGNARENNYASFEIFIRISTHSMVTFLTFLLKLLILSGRECNHYEFYKKKVFNH